MSAELAPREGETLDELLRGRIRLLQPRRGARVSLDSLLVADFAAGGGVGARVLDLGCGGGVVGLAIAVREPAASVVGVELVPEMAALARRNALLNGVAERVRVVEGDVRRAAELPLEPASFELVVANPPFHAEGAGRSAKDPARALARQELACSLGDVVACAARFVSPGGRVVIVFPAERLAELLLAMAEASLPLRTLRAVHSVAGDPARRVLVEGARGYRGGVQLLPPLVVHGADRRTYTDEAARILGETRGGPA